MRLLLDLLALIRALAADRARLALENLVLRQQITILKRGVKRARLEDSDRIFWVLPWAPLAIEKARRAGNRGNLPRNSYRGATQNTFSQAAIISSSTWAWLWSSYRTIHRTSCLPRIALPYPVP